MNKLLVGIAGAAGVGKDTVANILKKHFQFNQDAFAAPIKSMLKSIGIDEPIDRIGKERILPGWDFSYRKAAQTLGTEWGRTLQSDLWLQIAKNKIPNHARLCFSDVRFENEADLIRAHKGVIFHVEGRGTSASKENASHISESGILRHPSDFVIDNSTTHKQLIKNVFQVMQSMGQSIQQNSSNILLLSS